MWGCGYRHWEPRPWQPSSSQWEQTMRPLSPLCKLTQLAYWVFTIIASSGYCFSVTQSSPTLHSNGLQHNRLACASLSPWICSNSCPLSRWWHPTISSSVAPFSSCPQSFPTSGSFPMNWLFASGGQSVGASASASVVMNIQSWFPLRLTGLISLLPKGLSRVFSSTTVQKHQFTQPSLWSNSHICTWLLEKP